MKKGGKNEIESGLSGAYDVQCANDPRGASFWTLTPGLFLFTTHYSKFAMLSSSLPRHCARISRAVVGSESIFWLELSVSRLRSSRAIFLFLSSLIHVASN